MSILDLPDELVELVATAVRNRNLKDYFAFLTSWKRCHALSPLRGLTQGIIIRASDYDGIMRRFISYIDKIPRGKYLNDNAISLLAPDLNYRKLKEWLIFSYNDRQYILSRRLFGDPIFGPVDGSTVKLGEVIYRLP